MTWVRSADLTDLDPVTSLELSVFGHDAWSRQSVGVEFHRLGASRDIVVADEGGVVIGYAITSHSIDRAEVLRVAVDADHRRRGIATQLLDALLSRVEDAGISQTLLEVADDNPGARALYAGFGFAEIARRERYYRGQVDAVALRRDSMANANPRLTRGG